jgi:hypothetical protein
LHHAEKNLIMVQRCNKKSDREAHHDEVSKEKEVYVRVKDEAGNQFLCPIDALKDI